MTWPTVLVNTTNCDATGDSPSLFRTDVLDAIQKLNAIISSPPFASGVRIAFPQAAAPSGWTQDTSDAATNRMLRVVNTTGGGTGGTTTHSPILMNVVPSHTHGFTTGTESANHSHGIGDPTHTHGLSDPGHSHHILVDTGPAGVNYGLAPASGVFDNGTTSQAAATGISLAGAYTGIYTGGISANHTHSGSTDNGSSATSWQPRYIDLIICSKD